MHRIVSDISLLDPGYPRINWWRGRLRPFESLLSFTVNFCSLNSISSKEFDEYLAIENFNSQADKYNSIAILLGEDVQAIMQSFEGIPSLIDFGSYSLVYPREYKNVFKYCPQCIAYGYHSFLHNLVWMKACPFHLVSLIHRSCLGSDVDLLMELFSEYCQAWPFTESLDYALSSAATNGYTQLIQAWTANAFLKVKQLEADQLWKNTQGEDLALKNLPYSFGRMCAIERLPDLLRPLVIDHLQVELISKTFPKKSSTHSLDIFKKFHFDTIFYVYKIISSHSDIQLGFSKKLNKYREKIQKQHNGKCVWKRERAGWYYHWYKIDPDYYPFCLNCPYLIVQSDLELGWGRAEEHMSNRSCDKYLRHFYDCRQYLERSQVFSLKEGDEPAWFNISVLSKYMWLDEIVSEVLNKVAEYELDVFFMQARDWLTAVDSGGKPTKDSKIQGSVRVINNDGVIKILKWTQLS